MVTGLALAVLGLCGHAHAGPPPKKSAVPPPASSAAATTSPATASTTSPAPETKPAPPDPNLSDEERRYLDFRRAVDPLGNAGGKPATQPVTVSRSLNGSAIPHPDRWRMGWPRWDRYGRQTGSDPLLMNASGGDSPYTQGDALNPYDRNVLKGDYPINRAGNLFFSASAISDTFFNYRRLPTPSGVSAADSSQFDAFGDGKQLFISQTFLLSFELFQGYTAYRPPDWLIRVTPAFNVNHLELQEDNGVNIDVRDGDRRDDAFATLQEAFLDYHLGDLSPNFDVATLRAGRQFFISDFRGFVFSDVTDGLRVFGNAESNRLQYNLAFFNQSDKDTNSELTELKWREQQVLIANATWQDFIWHGYNTQVSFHWNHDQSDTEFDSNGFPVIPELAGTPLPHNIDAYYLGWTGDGHIGRLNIDHAFYYVTGRDDGNPIAGRGVDIGAYMGAVELSVDVDWLRPKFSVLYASGDGDPTDGRAGGFDGIVDNPTFAGGPSSFYQSQALRLLGVNLTSAKSFYNDLTSTKGEGQSNYVNPGTILVGGGLDVEVTPKLRASVNVNSIWMADTASVELLLNQQHVDTHLGCEADMVWQYRPFLNNNVILSVGGSLFFPGQGFTDIYETRTMLYQVFTGITLTY